MQENNNIKMLRYKAIRFGNQNKVAIATLQLLFDSKTNENINVAHAHALHDKFRTNKAKVIKIEDQLGNDLKEGYSSRDKNFKYVSGEIVEVFNFDYNLERVYTKGIHYFKNKEQAKCYFNLTTIKNG